MYRKTIENLVAWRDNVKRKPLVLQGARQVGKTYLVKKFAEENYEHFINIPLYLAGRIQSIIE